MEKPILFSTPMVQAILEGRKTQTRRVFKFPKWMQVDTAIDDVGQVWCERELAQNRCPYGQVGNRLWVRETFCDDCSSRLDNAVCFKANRENQPASDFCTKWKPSIFMPRWASRITLEITDIRVQRLQEITKEDVKAEGFKRLYSELLIMSEDKDCWSDSFFKTWEQINGRKQGYDWDSNPFVWVISFKRI